MERNPTNAYQQASDEHGRSIAMVSAGVAARKRSGSGGGILSKLPFIRTSESKTSLREQRNLGASDDPHDPLGAASGPVPQQKVRRRKGSLRKVALLGRGAQRERRETKQSSTLADSVTAQSLGTAHSAWGDNEGGSGSNGVAMTSAGSEVTPPLVVQINDDEHDVDDKVLDMRSAVHTRQRPRVTDADSSVTSPRESYTSTDEDDAFPVTRSASPLRPVVADFNSSGSDSYYFDKPARASSISVPRRRSFKNSTSPLSLQGLASTTMPEPNLDHDYGETEFWGWVVLVVTWVVFVIGMGSCLGIWTWAWDVGSTPYSQPELEYDPTLPIPGYYPTLIILTCIMAWVWVVTAWVGMKYFRHAKITSD